MTVPGQFPQQRVGVFVDIQNMYYSARALFNQKVNFKNVLAAAVSGRHLVRALAYGITTEEAHEGEFHAALATQGFEVKTKPLQTFVGGQKKGDWDVGIAMDVLQLEPKIDVAVLVSGDGDFIPLVQFAKGKGLRFEVIGFRESTSSALVAVADNFTDLSQDPPQFLINGRGSPPSRVHSPLRRGDGPLARRPGGPTRRLGGTARPRVQRRPKIIR